MKLYSVIESECLNDEFLTNKHPILESTMKKYLKMKKVAKSHRSVLGNKKEPSRYSKGML